MAKKAKNVGVIFILIVLYMASVGGAFYLGQMNVEKNSYTKTTNPTKVQKAYWGTYTSDEYKFSFEYPRAVSINRYWQRESAQAEVKESIAVEMPGLSASIRSMFSVEVYESTLDPKTWWNQVGKIEYGNLRNAEVDDATLGIVIGTETQPNGISVTGVTSYPKYYVGPPGDYKRNMFIIKNNGYIYVIEDSTEDYWWEDNEMREIKRYQPIRRTFKFL